MLTHFFLRNRKNILGNPTRSAARSVQSKSFQVSLPRLLLQGGTFADGAHTKHKAEAYHLHLPVRWGPGGSGCSDRLAPRVSLAAA